MAETEIHPGAADTHADSRGDLTALLRGFRGRMLRVGGGAALAWGAVGALACLIFGTWTDLVFELSPALRIGVCLASACLGIVLLTWIGLRTWRRGRSELLARRLDEVGNTGGEILAGTDLAADPTTRAPLTRGLAQIAIGRAARLASQVSARAAVPGRPLALAAAGIATIAGLIVVAAVLLPAMVKTEYLRFRDPFGELVADGDCDHEHSRLQRNRGS
jgi:hypothetical protein